MKILIRTVYKVLIRNYLGSPNVLQMEQNSLKDIDTIVIDLSYKNKNIMGKGIIYVTL